MTKAKELCEKICSIYTRGQLEAVAKRAGYKNVEKMLRSRLEQIVYVYEMCSDGVRDNYRIFDNVTGEILVNWCGRKYMVDWIIRNCLFNWYDEQEYPIMRGLHHEIRVVSLRR